MLEFEEYKVKLNNLKPELEELYTSLGLEQAKREVEELEIKSSQPGFWDNPEESQMCIRDSHLVDNLCMVAAEIAVHDIRPVQTLQLLPVARQTDIVAVGLREGFRQPALHFGAAAVLLLSLIHI